MKSFQSRALDLGYCPLCGAHELEADEGEATDAKVLANGTKIRVLYERLLRVESRALVKPGPLDNQGQSPVFES